MTITTYNPLLLSIPLLIVLIFLKLLYPELLFSRLPLYVILLIAGLCLFGINYFGVNKVVVIDKLNKKLQIRKTTFSGEKIDESDTDDIKEIMYLKTWGLNTLKPYTIHAIYALGGNNDSTVLFMEESNWPTYHYIHKDSLENLAVEISDYLGLPLKIQRN